MVAHFWVEGMKGWKNFRGRYMTTSRSEPQRADTAAMARLKPSPES